MKGFTLIEVLIAIFLLTLGIVGVISIFPLGAQTVKSSQMASQASQLAGSKMEGMLSKTYDDPALTPGTTVEDYGTIPNFDFRKRITNVTCVRSDTLAEVACDYNPGEDPNPMKKIEVSVFWLSSTGITEKNVKVVGLTTKK